VRVVDEVAKLDCGEFAHVLDLEANFLALQESVEEVPARRSPRLHVVPGSSSPTLPAGTVRYSFTVLLTGCQAAGSRMTLTSEIHT